MGAGHSHGEGQSRRRLGVVLGLTAVVFLAEVLGAVVTGSLALLTDAGHMLVDVLGLGMAFFAAGLMLRPATGRRTWGLRRAEVLAAGAQATLLTVVGLYAVGEGISRLADPPEVPGPELLAFGVVGLAANVIGLLVLHGGRHQGLNMRAAFLEVAADALGSVAVIAAAAVIWTTGWTRADAVAGILIAVIIIPRAFFILREVLHILLEGTPPQIDVGEVRRHILSRPHVLGVHDLHISLIDSKMPVLTAHVVLEDECFRDECAPEILQDLQACVGEHFEPAITHSTFQLERAGHARREHLAGLCGASDDAPGSRRGRLS
ncbi:cation diffusion facilitator family transporter [Brevibacterium daeguense]|uniref:Cation diffusion facilitator family transporter n=1 Tax=Brevibacterium daeguense TaxID=909936 RepID=A0ABP8EHW7_9MICO|nr:cation diffusion facilitator family transporter [Brevibacterium daeguense]